MRRAITWFLVLRTCLLAVCTNGTMQSPDPVSQQGVATSIAMTLPFSATAGDSVLVLFTWQLSGGTNATATDTSGTLYTQLSNTTATVAGTPYSIAWLCGTLPTSGKPTITARIGGFPFQFAYITAYPLHGTSCTQVGSTGSSTANAGSGGNSRWTSSGVVVPSGITAVLFAAAVAPDLNPGANETWTADTGYIEEVDNDYAGGIAIESRTVGAGTYTPGITVNVPGLAGMIAVIALQVNGAPTNDKCLSTGVYSTGDSIMRLRGSIPVLQQMWLEVGAANANSAAGQMAVHNHGTGNQTLTQIDSLLPATITPYIDISREHNYCVENGGINDWVVNPFLTGAQLWTLAQTLINHSISAGCEKVFFLTITSTNDGTGSGVMPDAVRNAYNALIVNNAALICNTSGCTSNAGSIAQLVAVDAGADPLVGNHACAGSPNTYFINCPHPTPAGDSEIARSLTTAFNYFLVSPISVTAPADASIITWDISGGGPNLIASLSNLPSAARVEFWVDNRLECTDHVIQFGKPTCKLYNPLFSDSHSMQVYAKAYDSLGNLLATSNTNTFRLDNYGINAVNSFDQSSPVSGVLTWTQGNNATSITPEPTYKAVIDGMDYTHPTYGRRHVSTSASNLNTATDTLTVPFVPAATGAQVTLVCSSLDQQVNCSSYPVPLTGAAIAYAIVIDGNHLKLATSKANAVAGVAIDFTTQGDAGAIISLTFEADWYTAGGPTRFSVDTRYFPNGTHRMESILQAGTSTGLPTGTLTFVAADVDTTNNWVTHSNYPFTQGESVTVTNTGGALPGGLTSPATIDLIDQTHFRFHGQTLTNAGSGIQTIAFTVPAGGWAIPNAVGISAVWGADTTFLNFENGNAVMELRTQFGKLVLANGETVCLAPFLQRTDGTITSLTPSTLLYGTSDAGIATVNPSGCVTGGSKYGEGYISVIDNADSRWALVTVRQVANHTEFKHFTIGHGIQSTYSPTYSVPVVAPFSAEAISQAQIPFPTQEPSAWWKYSGINTVLGGYNTSWASFNDYNSWLNYWTNASMNDPVSGWVTLYNKYRLPMMAFLNPACTGGGQQGGVAGFATRLQAYPWVQQAHAKELSDIYPFTTNADVCDEINSWFGVLARPNGAIGSGDDGLQTPGCTPGTCGLEKIVVTGCAATPCLGTGTVTWRTYNDLRTYQTSFEFTGATTANLNGPYTAMAQTYDHTKIGGPLVTFEIVTKDVLNGTYNSSTDPNLHAYPALHCYGIICYTPAAFSHGPYYLGSAGAASSIAVSDSGGGAANLGTVHWTDHGITDGCSIQLSTFSASGLNGYYRADVVDANTIHIRMGAGASNGTYTDAGASIDPLQCPPVSDSFNVDFDRTWVTGNHPPFGAPPIGGGDWIMQVSYQGPGNPPYSDYNSVYWANVTGDRYGTWGSQQQTTYWNLFQHWLPTFGPNFNVYKDAPFLLETTLEAEACLGITSWGWNCNTDTIPGDKILFSRRGPSSIFTTTFWPWTFGAAGIRPYVLVTGLGKTIWQNSPGSPLVGEQNAVDYMDAHPENWLGFAMSSVFTGKLARYVLSPLCHSPYLGPLVFTGARCIADNGGNLLMVGTWSESDQALHIDFTPYRLGGAIRRYTFGCYGITVASLSPSAAGDDPTLPYCGAIAYVFQPAGAADELTTVRQVLNPSAIPGATKAVLEIHYYPKDQQFQAVDCGTGACPAFKVDLNGGLDVWYRYKYTDNAGVAKAVSDFQRWPNAIPIAPPAGLYWTTLTDFDWTGMTNIQWTGLQN